MRDFYERFLTKENFYYEDEILLQGLGANGTCSKPSVRALLRRTGITGVKKVEVHTNKRTSHAYVQFVDGKSADAAVERFAKGDIVADRDGVQGMLRATSKLRPRVGFTSFVRERPFYVKDVQRNTCLCMACYSMKLLWLALSAFPYWEEVCPEIHELLQEAKVIAGAFTPTVDNILDVVLCPRDADTGFFAKDCALGNCDTCGWELFAGECAATASDSVSERTPAAGVPEEVSPCASYSFSDFDFLGWQPPGTKSMTKNDFWQGSTYLPIAPALGNLFSSVPTFFHVIDLGQCRTISLWMSARPWRLTRTLEAMSASSSI